jgi:hypothetical protein
MKLWQTMKISLQLIAVLFMIAYDYIVKVDKHVIRLLMIMLMMILFIIIYNHIVLCALIVGVVSSGAGTTDFNFGLFSSGEDYVFLVMMAMMMTMMMILIMAIMDMMIMIIIIVITIMLC